MKNILKHTLFWEVSYNDTFGKRFKLSFQSLLGKFHHIKLRNGCGFDSEFCTKTLFVKPHLCEVFLSQLIKINCRKPVSKEQLNHFDFVLECLLLDVRNKCLKRLHHLFTTFRLSGLQTKLLLHQNKEKMTLS